MLAPLSQHIRAHKIGKIRHKRALKMINKYCGLDITGFFHSRNKSKKTLWQLSHLATNCFLYCDVSRLVNIYMMKKL